MTTENERIERSAGTVVAVGGSFGRVGGGYRGLRDDQDEAVKRFARMLADSFKEHEIEIRYNTNRLGGGAWLKDGGRNNQVGLGAELKAPRRHRQRFETFLEYASDYADLGIRDFPSAEDVLDVGDRVLKFSVHLVPPAIPEEACNRQDQGFNDRTYHHELFDTFEAAWAFFAENLNKDGVRPPG